jgi:purine-binding chemotaxis protein CheW
MRPARDLVAFVVGDRRCALDLAAVERVEPMVAISSLPGAPPGVLGAVNVRGTAVAVFDLRARLGLTPAAPEPDGALVLARSSRRMVALPVDEALGVCSVDPADITEPERLDLERPFVAGVSTLTDGLVVIHDLDGFLSPDAERRLTPALAGGAP